MKNLATGEPVKNFFFKGLVAICHSFYIYFLSYTLQNKVDHITHNLLFDEAGAGGHYELNQWFF
jgi:hypothetical protein